jgi:ParB family chromosome partitioning protein
MQQVIESTEITYIELHRLKPNPYQPASRIDIDEDTAKRFGESILEFGLMQIPIGRKKGEDIEIGDGWLRRCGYSWLSNNHGGTFDKMPVNIRELTDRQMADLVMEANTIRKDLTPIDLAHLYTRYLADFKLTQQQLADELHLSQGEIANTIRLLDLPNLVQESVISRKITETHARQLLRINDKPAIQENLIKSSVERNWSVNQLAEEIGRIQYETSRPLASECSDIYRYPLFLVKETCADCGKKVKMGSPYRKEKKELRCQDPACWAKKNKEAEAAEAKQLKAEGEGGKVFTNKELPYNKYKSLDNYEFKQLGSPAECKNCEKRVKRREDNGGKKVELVCVDLKCFRSKQLAKTKADNAAAREKEGKVTQKIREAVDGALPGVLPGVMAVALVGYAERNGQANTFSYLAEALNIPITKKTAKADLLKWLQNSAGDSAMVLRLRFSSILMLNMLRDRDSMTFERSIAELEGRLDDYLAKIIKFQKQHCAQCRNVRNKELVGTGYKCCWNWVSEHPVEENSLGVASATGKCGSFMKIKKGSKGDGDAEEIQGGGSVDEKGEDVDGSDGSIDGDEGEGGDE